MQMGLVSLLSWLHFYRPVLPLLTQIDASKQYWVGINSGPGDPRGPNFSRNLLYFTMFIHSIHVPDTSASLSM